MVIGKNKTKYFKLLFFTKYDTNGAVEHCENVLLSFVVTLERIKLKVQQLKMTSSDKILLVDQLSSPSPKSIPPRPNPKEVPNPKVQLGLGVTQ